MEISFIIERRSHLDRRHLKDDRAAFISPNADPEQRRRERRNPNNPTNVVPVDNEEELVKEVKRLSEIDDIDVFASFDEDAQLIGIKVSH